jgi:hypothetical protein
MATFRLTLELSDPGQLPKLLRDVADRIETPPPGRGVGDTVGGAGGAIGAFALVDDDQAWQRTMRAQIRD